MGVFDFLDDLQTGAVEVFDDITDEIDGFFGFPDEATPAAPTPDPRRNPTVDTTEIDRANPQPAAFFAGTQIPRAVWYIGGALLLVIVARKVL